MGVPVVTLQNITVPIHVHNVSSSLLSRIPSVRGLITTSMASYVQTASELGDPANIDHLRTLRASLRHEMEESSLCDGETFTAHLQALYYRIYEFHHTNTPLGSASEPCDASSANVGDTSASITAPASLIIPLPLVDSSQVPPVACDPSQSVGMHKWKTK